MKKSIIWMLIAVLALSGAACTSDFEELNTDPNKVYDIEPEYLLTRMWMRYNGSPHEEHRGAVIMAAPLAGLFQCGYRTGQAFDGTNDSYNEAKMVEMYNDAIRSSVQLIYNLENDKSEEDHAAKLAIAKIALQFSYQRITDLYGDIPYEGTGLGYLEDIFYLAYDSQEDIYKNGVQRLKEARNLLLSTQAVPFSNTGDIIFGGIEDMTERKQAWAKLANSLILRMGLRGVNGDEQWARATVEEAANHAAGFITSLENTDAAIMPTGDVAGDWGLIVNGAASLLSGTGAYAFVGEEWLRQAQINRDPRIFYVAAQAEAVGSRWTAWTGQEDFDAFEEAARPGEPFKPVTFNPLRGGGTESYSVRGLMVMTKESVKRDPERIFGNWVIDAEKSVRYNQFHTMAVVNPETLGHRAAPIFVFAGDETYYILAEAALRGWNVPGDAKSNLEKAVQLSLDKYPKYFNHGNSPAIYMSKQSATEGVSITYEGLAADYITKITSGAIDYQTIWRERWKSCMTAQGGYEAFAIWNRTNLEFLPGYSSTGRPYPGTLNMDIPIYDTLEVVPDKLILGVPVPASVYSSEPFHNGGSTDGWRPRRLNYPNSERSNNAENVGAAINRQIAEYGQAGNGAHFVTTYQWYSKKD